MLMFDLKIQDQNSDGIIVRGSGGVLCSGIACDGGGNRMSDCLNTVVSCYGRFYRNQRER